MKIINAAKLIENIQPSKVDKWLTVGCAALLGLLLCLIVITDVNGAGFDDHFVSRFPYNCSHNYSPNERPNFPGVNEPNEKAKIRYNFNKVYSKLKSNKFKVSFNFSSLNHCERIISHKGVSLKSALSYKSGLEQFSKGFKMSKYSETVPLKLGEFYQIANTSNNDDEYVYGEFKTYGHRVELQLGAISLRSGFSTNLEDYNDMDFAIGPSMIVNSFKTGVGIKIGNAKIIYDLNQHKSNLGMKHKIALNVQWGGNNS